MLISLFVNYINFRAFTRKQKPFIRRVISSMHSFIITVDTSCDKIRRSLSWEFRRLKRPLTMPLEVRYDFHKRLLEFLHV